MTAVASSAAILFQSELASVNTTSAETIARFQSAKVDEHVSGAAQQFVTQDGAIIPFRMAWLSRVMDHGA